MGRRLERLFAAGLIPQDLELVFLGREICAVAVMHSEDGLTRADIIDYPAFWQVMEVEMPLAAAGRRSWKFSRHMDLAELIERVRAWGLDRESAPEGWEWEYVAGEYRRQADGPKQPPAGIYIMPVNPDNTES
jgi:hypothetical protein